MDDPIFDTWWGGLDDVSGWASASHWNRSEASGPESTRPEAPPLTRAMRGRERGIVGVLRAAALPRVQAVARRLVARGHQATVEDLLDDDPAVLRLRLRPAPGLMDGDDLGFATLELAVSTGVPERVTAWSWLDPSDEAPGSMASVSASELGAAWLDTNVLGFVANVLSRS